MLIPTLANSSLGSISCIIFSLRKWLFGLLYMHQKHRRFLWNRVRNGEHRDTLGFTGYSPLLGWDANGATRQGTAFPGWTWRKLPVWMNHKQLWQSINNWWAGAPSGHRVPHRTLLFSTAPSPGHASVPKDTPPMFLLETIKCGEITEIISRTDGTFAHELSEVLSDAIWASHTAPLTGSTGCCTCMYAAQEIVGGRKCMSEAENPRNSIYVG